MLSQKHQSGHTASQGALLHQNVMARNTSQTTQPHKEPCYTTRWRQETPVRPHSLIGSLATPECDGQKHQSGHSLIGSLATPECDGQKHQSGHTAWEGALLHQKETGINTSQATKPDREPCYTRRWQPETPVRPHSLTGSLAAPEGDVQKHQSGHTAW